jgi:hypothetical protein
MNKNNWDIYAVYAAIVAAATALFYLSIYLIVKNI